MARIHFLLCVAAIIPATPASAQETPAPLVAMLTRSLAPNLTLERYLGMRKLEFSRLDADDDGTITKADMDFEAARRAADARANAIQHILRFDFDGDGVVTHAEVGQMLIQSLSLSPLGMHLPAGFEAQREVAIRQQMQADRNGDGRIDGAEMMAFAEAQPVRPNPPSLPDDVLPVAEADFLRAAEGLFRSADANADGTLSQAEVQAIRKR